MAENAEAPPPPPTPHQTWAKTTLWVLVVFIFVVNAVIVFKSCRDLPGDAIDKTGKVIDKAGRALADLASAFNQGRITTEFISYATTLSNQHYLQFATLKQTEIFTRKTNRPQARLHSLPKWSSKRAPVEYTYYLDLNAKWDFVLKDNVLYVLPAHSVQQAGRGRFGDYLRGQKGYFKTAEAQENLRSRSLSRGLEGRENIRWCVRTGGGRSPSLSKDGC
jgi:hypothetical protein